MLCHAQFLPQEDLNKLSFFPELVKFGMEPVSVRFGDTCCRCKGNGSPDDAALATGGHESAFPVDLVASCLFEMTSEEHFDAFANRRGICQDDSPAIFEGTSTPHQINDWLQHFQKRIDGITGGTFFQFSADA